MWKNPPFSLCLGSTEPAAITKRPLGTIADKIIKIPKQIQGNENAQPSHSEGGLIALGLVHLEVDYFELACICRVWTGLGPGFGKVIKIDCTCACEVAWEGK